MGVARGQHRGRLADGPQRVEGRTHRDRRGRQLDSLLDRRTRASAAARRRRRAGARDPRGALRQHVRESIADPLLALVQRTILLGGLRIYAASVRVCRDLRAGRGDRFVGPVVRAGAAQPALRPAAVGVCELRRLECRAAHAGRAAPPVDLVVDVGGRRRDSFDYRSVRRYRTTARMVDRGRCEPALTHDGGRGAGRPARTTAPLGSEDRDGCRGARADGCRRRIPRSTRRAGLLDRGSRTARIARRLAPHLELGRYRPARRACRRQRRSSRWLSHLVAAAGARFGPWALPLRRRHDTGSAVGWDECAGGK